MAFVITQACCSDAACVSVCPVQCIRPRPGDPDFTTTEQLYIDPVTCIDCGACVDVCPVEAISADADLPERLGDYLDINAAYFADNPIEEDVPRPAARRVLPADSGLRIAVVGAGPAGCYAVDALTDVKGVSVSVFERLPTPFGLLRAGVAPDHLSTKLIAERFRGVLSRRSVRCFFNVEVGRDISVDELLQHHHAVLWAGGAAHDRRLDIPGEDLPGSHSAREFVAWYNGHPDYADQRFDLTGERVIVIGNGNVALDVARVLTRPADAYAATDMADHALVVLRSSGVGEVIVAGRRGISSAACASSELLALSRLEGVDLLARTEEIGDATAESGDPTVRRKAELMRAAANREPSAGHRRITMRFFLAPLRIEGTERVTGVTFARMRLVDDEGEVRIEPTGEVETIEASLVFRAIGYRGTAPADLPFDERSATISHDRGRVAERPGRYVTGWIKRGAAGVIGTNRPDALETVTSLLDDFEAGALLEPAHDHEHLVTLVTQRRPDVLDNAAWLRINSAEVKNGRQARRSRVKFVSVDDLLAASRD